MNMKTGKKWWASLSAAEQEAYIAAKERSRKGSRLDRTGQRVSLPNGLVGIWHGRDIYTVYKPFMLDKDGQPYPKWLPKYI